MMVRKRTQPGNSRKSYHMLQAGLVITYLSLILGRFYNMDLLRMAGAYVMTEAVLFRRVEMKGRNDKAVWLMFLYLGLMGSTMICSGMAYVRGWQECLSNINLLIFGVFFSLFIYRLEKIQKREGHMLLKTVLAVWGAVICVGVVRKDANPCILALWAAVLGGVSLLAFLQISRFVENISLECRDTATGKSRAIFYIVMIVSFLCFWGGRITLSYMASICPIEANKESMEQRDEGIIKSMTEAGFPDDVVTFMPAEEIKQYKNIKGCKVYTCINGIKEDSADIKNLEVILIISDLGKNEEGEEQKRLMFFGTWKKNPQHRITDQLQADFGAENASRILAYGEYKDPAGGNMGVPFKRKQKDKAMTEGASRIEYEAPLPRTGSEYHFILGGMVVGQGEQPAERQIVLRYRHQTSILFNPFGKIRSSKGETSNYEEQEYRFIAEF